MTGLEHDIRKLKDHYDRQSDAFPSGSQKDIAYKKWYLHQLNLIAYKYKHLEGTGDQSALTTLSIQRQSLEQSLPGRFKAIRRYFSQVRNWILGNKEESVVIARQADGHQRILYQLREAGLGKLIDQAEKSMKDGIPEFSLSTSQEVSRDQSITSQVSFAKDDCGKYALNYKAKLFTQGKNGVEVRSLDNEGNGLFSQEQAINLLSGRAIKVHYYIQGQPHTEWLSLDQSDVNTKGASRIKRYDTAYGYNLSTCLDNLTDNGVQLQDLKEAIIRKLENGNQVSVLLLHQGKEKVIRISADPAGKGFMFYDEQGKQVSRDKAWGKENANTNNIRIAVQRPNRSLKVH